MAIEIEVKEVTPRHYVGIRRVVKHDGLGPLCGEVLPKLSAWLAERGKSPDGAPALVYHSVNQETGDFDVEPVLFVAEAVEAHGEISHAETPGGEVLYTRHVGPYGTLGESWHAMFARAEAMGRRVTRRSWEVYVDDPSKVEESVLTTEIYVPIDPE